MMIKKKVLNPDRIRRIHGGFSFIPHRFLSQGFLSALQQKEILLYLFLVLASDRHGLSFYSYDTICTLLQMNLDQYINARNGLIDKDLIAFDGTVFQVLELPRNARLIANKIAGRPQTNKAAGVHRPSCRPVAKTDGAMMENRQTTAERVIIALKQAIKDHLQWMASQGYAQSTQKEYRWRLTQFTNLIKSGSYGWEDIFTFATIKCFKGPVHAITNLSRYLYAQGKIAQPIRYPTPSVNLPDVFEDYLRYRKKFHQTPERTIKASRRVLNAFAHYLQRHRIKLQAVDIEQIDAFLKTFSKRVLNCLLPRLSVLSTWIFSLPVRRTAIIGQRHGAAGYRTAIICPAKTA